MRVNKGKNVNIFGGGTAPCIPNTFVLQELAPPKRCEFISLSDYCQVTPPFFSCEGEPREEGEKEPQQNKTNNRKKPLPSLSKWRDDDEVKKKEKENCLDLPNEKEMNKKEDSPLLN